MTVKELIEELKRLDENLIVIDINHEVQFKIELECFYRDEFGNRVKANCARLV